MTDVTRETHERTAIGESKRDDTSGTLSRRAAMCALGLTDLGLVSGSVGAQEEEGRRPWCNWDREVNTDGNGLRTLGHLEMAATEEPIADLAGENLSIDEGVLNDTVPDTVGSLVNVVDIDDYGADPTDDGPSDEALDAAIDELTDGGYLVMTNGEY